MALNDIVEVVVLDVLHHDVSLKRVPEVRCRVWEKRICVEWSLWRWAVTSRWVLVELVWNSELGDEKCIIDDICISHMCISDVGWGIVVYDFVGYRGEFILYLISYIEQVSCWSNVEEE